MALWKREAEKRKRRAAKKDEDELADILGMPRPSMKTKNAENEKESDFDFLNRDQGDLAALLDGGTGGESADRIKTDEEKSESCAKIEF